MSAPTQSRYVAYSEDYPNMLKLVQDARCATTLLNVANWKKTTMRTGVGAGGSTENRLAKNLEGISVDCAASIYRCLAYFISFVQRDNNIDTPRKVQDLITCGLVNFCINIIRHEKEHFNIAVKIVKCLLRHYSTGLKHAPKDNIGVVLYTMCYEAQLLPVLVSRLIKLNIRFAVRTREASFETGDTTGELYHREEELRGIDRLISFLIQYEPCFNQIKTAPSIRRLILACVSSNLASDNVASAVCVPRQLLHRIIEEFVMFEFAKRFTNQDYIGSDFLEIIEAAIGIIREIDTYNTSLHAIIEEEDEEEDEDEGGDVEDESSDDEENISKHNLSSGELGKDWIVSKKIQDLVICECLILLGGVFTGKIGRPMISYQAKTIDTCFDCFIKQLNSSSSMVVRKAIGALIELLGRQKLVGWGPDMMYSVTKVIHPDLIGQIHRLLSSEDVEIVARTIELVNVVVISFSGDFARNEIRKQGIPDKIRRLCSNTTSDRIRVAGMIYGANL